jgi:MFS family permease
MVRKDAAPAIGDPAAPLTRWQRFATPGSIAGALRHDAFRGLWASGWVYFIGNAMQTMAAAWMMVERTGSSFLAALVQTAVFLPMFLLALPAGVLADITDRRRLILSALAVQAVAGALLAVLLFLDLAGAGLILFFVFISGCCTALLSPAWNSAVADSIPRSELPQAIMAVSIAYNAARALGPTLAGLVFAWISGSWNFVFAVLSTLAMMAAIQHWPPSRHPPSRLPPERLWTGMASGLRFAWHSHLILAQLVRTAAYGGAGSALWALLPVIGQRQLGMGADGYGFLMGCMGSGAVAAGLVIGRLRLRLGLERLVALCCGVFAAVMLVASTVTLRPVVYLSLALGGAAWMSVMSTFNTATQTSAPPWVRARAVAMHTLSALGAFAMGSAFWGAFAGIAGLQAALWVAAAAMAAGYFLARPFPLRMGEHQDVTPATAWEEYIVAGEPDPDAGPVAVEIGYRVGESDAPAFLEAVTLLRAPRRRDGATMWRVYRDLADPTRYAERFIVNSWAEYLHQRARATLADQELETAVRAFQLEGVPVTTQHYVAER